MDHHSNDAMDERQRVRAAHPYLLSLPMPFPVRSHCWLSCLFLGSLFCYVLLFTLFLFSCFFFSGRVFLTLTVDELVELGVTNKFHQRALILLQKENTSPGPSNSSSFDASPSKREAMRRVFDFLASLNLRLCISWFDSWCYVIALCCFMSSAAPSPSHHFCISHYTTAWLMQGFSKNWRMENRHVSVNRKRTTNVREEKVSDWT